MLVIPEFVGKLNYLPKTTTSKMRINGESQIIARAAKFSDFDEFMEFVAAWDVDFRQVGPGELNASLAQVVGDSWSLSKARFDQFSYQQGVAVPGMRTFAIQGPTAPESDWCGRGFSSKNMAVFARDGEFRSISPAGFDVYTLSFTEEYLSSTCEQLDIPDVVPKLGVVDSVLQCDARLSTTLRNLVSAAIDELCSPGPQGPSLSRGNFYRDKICSFLLLQLSQGNSIRRAPSLRVRSLAMQRALDVMEDGGIQVRTVSELANACGMSRRSLEYAFRERFDMSPKTFMNAQRLIGVRRDLRNSADGRPIADYANKWGFWHMGQFAQAYRQYFGELPSQTRRRYRLKP